MVTLIELKARNFKHLKGPGEEPFQIDFENLMGVTAIQGRNESGKTSVMEAICFALLGAGVKSRGEKLEDYIRYGANFTDVKLRFKVGEDEYLVHRKIYRKKSGHDAWLYRVLRDEKGDERLIRVAVKPATVDEVLREILGLDAETFKSTVLILQKDLKRLLEKGPSEREALINAIMGRECYDIAVERLKERRKELRGPHGKGGELDREKDKLKQLEELESQYREKRERKEHIQSEINQLEVELSNLDESINTLKEQVNLLEEYREALSKKVALEGKIEGYRENKGELKKRLEELKKQIEEAKRYAKVAEELKRLRKLRSIYTGLKTRVLGLMGLVLLFIGLSLFFIRIFIFGAVMLILGTPLIGFSIKRLALDNLRVGREIEKLIPMEEKYKRLPELENELKMVNSRLEKADKEIRKLQRQLEEIKLPELPEELKPYSSDLLEEKREKYEEILKKREGKSQRLEDLKEELSEVKEFLEKHEDIERKVKEQRRLIQQLEHELELIEVTIRIIKETADATRRQVRPAMEDYMASILPRITNGKYADVQLLEDFRMKVYDTDAGEYRLMERFSGGTEDQFLLALRLAFTLSLIPKMKGTYPRFLFLDEAFVSSDSERRRAIMLLLKKELRETFDQIIVISHHEDVLKEADHRITLSEGRIIHRS
ncbi:MAG: ATP-binding protein [Candidatus Freyarchaeota archaeon]